MGKIKENRIKLEKAGKIGTLGPRCAYGPRLQGGEGNTGAEGPGHGYYFQRGKGNIEAESLFYYKAKRRGLAPECLGLVPDCFPKRSKHQHFG